ncbi:hypothetical protein H0H92_004404, partial [Tricholoma furcatifolium]
RRDQTSWGLRRLPWEAPAQHREVQRNSHMEQRTFHPRGAPRRYPRHARRVFRLSRLATRHWLQNRSRRSIAPLLQRLSIFIPRSKCVLSCGAGASLKEYRHTIRTRGRRTFERRGCQRSTRGWWTVCDGASSLLSHPFPGPRSHPTTHPSLLSRRSSRRLLPRSFRRDDTLGLSREKTSKTSSVLSKVPPSPSSLSQGNRGSTESFKISLSPTLPLPLSPARRSTPKPTPMISPAPGVPSTPSPCSSRDFHRTPRRLCVTSRRPIEPYPCTRASGRLWSSERGRTRSASTDFSVLGPHPLQEATASLQMWLSTSCGTLALALSPNGWTITGLFAYLGNTWRSTTAGDDFGDKTYCVVEKCAQAAEFGMGVSFSMTARWRRWTTNAPSPYSTSLGTPRGPRKTRSFPIAWQMSTPSPSVWAYLGNHPKTGLSQKETPSSGWNGVWPAPQCQFLRPKWRS